MVEICFLYDGKKKNWGIHLPIYIPQGDKGSMTIVWGDICRECRQAGSIGIVTSQITLGDFSDRMKKFEKFSWTNELCLMRKF